MALGSIIGTASGIIGKGVSAAGGGSSLGGIFGAGANILGGLGGIGGGLFGGGSEPSYEEILQGVANEKRLEFQIEGLDKYRDFYNQYYWPIEGFNASNYYTDIKTARPFEERMRDYQLGRGDELVGLAGETNPLLDDNKKSLIRRLTEGEDVLADRYRGQASADVASSFDQQRTGISNQMARYGINPNSGAWANQMNTLGRNEALAQAGARTNATWQAEDTSLQRQMQAQNYYTNPTMQYDAGTITPGYSMSQLMGGSGGVGSRTAGNSGSNASGGSIWGSLGSSLGLLGGGLDTLNSKFNWI